MVSIKSLAVIIFSVGVAVAVIPPQLGNALDTNGQDDKGQGDKGQGNNPGNNVNIEDNHKECAKQNQEMFCCNDLAHKGDYTHTGVLENTKVKCNTVPADVIAISAASGKSVCDGKAACCTNKADKNGAFNIAAGCTALGGVN